MSNFQDLINTHFTSVVKTRGYEYYEDDRVTNIRLMKNFVLASVKGTEIYDVRLVFNKDLVPETLLCSCPFEGEKLCKHIAAVFYKLNSFGFFTAKYYKEQIGKSIDGDKPNFNVFQIRPVESVTSVVEIKPEIKSDVADLEVRRQKLNALIEAKRQEEEFSRLKSTFNLLTYDKANHTKETNYKISFGLEIKGYRTKFFVFRERIKKDGTPDGNRSIISKLNHSLIKDFSLEEQLLIKLLSTQNFECFMLVTEKEAAARKNSSESKSIFDEILNYLRRKDVYLLKGYRDTSIKLLFHEDVARATVQIDEDDKGFVLSLNISVNGQPLDSSSKFIPVINSPLWLLHSNTLYKVGNLTYEQFYPFYSANGKISVSNKYINYFEDTLLPQIASSLDLVSSKYEVFELNEIPTKQIYFEEKDDSVLGTLKFTYGQSEVHFNERETVFSFFKDSKIHKINRDKTYEEQAYYELTRFKIKFFENGTFVPKSNVLDFLFEAVPALKELGFEIIGIENLKKYQPRFDNLKIKYAISSGVDWFDLEAEVTFGNILVPFEDLLSAVKNKKRYLRLSDGSVGLLPEEWIKKFAKNFLLGEEMDNSLRLSKSQINVLAQLIESEENISSDKKFKDYIDKLNSFEKTKRHKVSPLFIGKLRRYQKAGYDWLHFLQEFGFGGILADDMGLGKTIQILAMMCKQKERKLSKPNLIIAPTSVLFNWINEIQKFAPSLTVLSHYGTLRKKDEDSYFENFDIILTTYTTALKDIAFLRQIEFNYVILDESQKIKNPFAQTSKAVAKLTADNKLCLTGTPIENNLLELWSQMNFLNPGILGSIKNFNEDFRIPIEKENSIEKTEYLKRLIFPFILRRTKDVVAKELPEKSEIIHYCEMTEEQNNTYDIWRDSIRSEILTSIENNGVKKSSFKVLEGLLRLRQICNHPKLVDNKYSHLSGKFEEFKELIVEVTSEGHKVLVFSQFVQMLDILKIYLQRIKIKHEYLTGSTKDRESCVNNFQNNPDVKVFLISLKAGGFGLNLTAADYVFHIDPWWNPAVELQATDRSHRIGQDKKVFVYKFITKNSVEEKILLLQDKKKKVVEAVLASESGVFKNLTKEDIEHLLS